MGDRRMLRIYCCYDLLSTFIQPLRLYNRDQAISQYWIFIITSNTTSYRIKSTKSYDFYSSTICISYNFIDVLFDVANITRTRKILPSSIESDPHLCMKGRVSTLYIQIPARRGIKMNKGGPEGVEGLVKRIHIKTHNEDEGTCLRPRRA